MLQEKRKVEHACQREREKKTERDRQIDSVRERKMKRGEDQGSIQGHT